MNRSLRFCLVLHNHQPVGNFDWVFENAYQDSYRPFLDLFEPFESIRLSLHTSGPLLEWLDQNHPDYLDRIARLVAAERLEILGGPYYEPILTMLSRRDRQGQMRRYSQRLAERLGATVRGMWVPERVWEASLVSDIAASGIGYTVLDDFHFRCAGLTSDALHGSYVTEDEGSVVRVFPGSERLRYLIPFAAPEESIAELRRVYEQHPGSVVVFADDGEKFGTWPDTKAHVYDQGWLRRFFEQLAANADWLTTSTLAEAVETVPPIGKIYLPNASYREMTEWALPVERQVALERLGHERVDDPAWHEIRPMICGGFWRNFKVKYPEANEMYARMMEISRRLEQLSDASEEPIEEKRRRVEQALYRGQCNCPYWHGAFGGIYLPHLRHAIYSELITADNLLDEIQGRTADQVEATVEDWDFDGSAEIRLANRHLAAYIAPAQGGMLYELDVRPIAHNCLATLARRPEAYHEKVKRGPTAEGDHVASIHDRVVFKQEGLDQQLIYDARPRKSFLERFVGPDTTSDSLWRGTATDHGDFVDSTYDARIRRKPGRIQVVLEREGRVGDAPVRLRKGITLEGNSRQIEVAYFLENLPRDTTYRLALEWGFSGMPAGADDRYFFDEHEQPIGQLGDRLDLTGVSHFGLADDWLGLRIGFDIERPTDIWTFPIETVSQSEGGFELVHQSVTVIPSWIVEPDAEGRWSTVFRLNFATPRQIEDEPTESASRHAEGLVAAP